VLNQEVYAITKQLNDMSELKDLIAQAGAQMEKTVEHLEEALARVRAGKANIKILDGIMVEYYGSLVPLTQVGTVTVPDAKSIVITPWEKGIIRDIERAIINSPLGITPENNGEVVRLGIPPLTEDRRRELVKQVKADTETAKVSIRNARRDTNELIKKSIKADNTPEDVAKDAEADVQKLHDRYIKRVDELFAAKEKEIMTV
jgi:ribosome recycling factor